MGLQYWIDLANSNSFYYTLIIKNGFDTPVKIERCPFYGCYWINPFDHIYKGVM